MLAGLPLRDASGTVVPCPPAEAPNAALRRHRSRQVIEQSSGASTKPLASLVGSVCSVRTHPKSERHSLSNPCVSNFSVRLFSVTVRTT